MNTIEADSERLRKLHRETRQRIADEVEQVLAERIESITDITSPKPLGYCMILKQWKATCFLKH